MRTVQCSSGDVEGISCGMTPRRIISWQHSVVTATARLLQVSFELNVLATVVHR